MSRRHRSKPGGALLSYPGVQFYGFDENAVIIAYMVVCRAHPYYRAVRPPRVDCKTCQTMYERCITRST